MSAAALERAIEPFFTTKDLHSGSGLGLSSVYGFVKQSGGDIRLLSSEEKGTTVEILLPTVPSRETGAGVERVGNQVALEGKKLLLVEDNDMLAGVLQGMLATMEISVDRVDSGPAAKQRLQQSDHYDFLLSDIRMPGGMNGFELAQWAQSSCDGLNIVLMSGFVDSAQNPTNFNVLQKPFKKEDLAFALGREPSMQE